jgi:hypothetical protein
MIIEFMITSSLMERCHPLYLVHCIQVIEVNEVWLA